MDYFILIVLIICAIVWGIDSFVTADETVELDDGSVRYRPSKYKGIVDYIKKKYYAED